MGVELALIVVAVFLIAGAGVYRWGKKPSARQREIARRNYLRDIEDDR